MSGKKADGSGGFTLVELVIGIVVLGIVATSFFGLFTSLVRSGLVAKRKAVANSLATNQIEYLKSLPYDNLAVSGGSIIATSYLPSTKTQSIDGFSYTIVTSINYVDDAFDGCLVSALCRNKPAPPAATTDNNPADYKIIHVSVRNSTGNVLSAVDTQVSARVAETSSTTGALAVTVIDTNGNPVPGANVNVADTTLAPAVNVNDTTDSNGIAIFYNLPPDTSAFDYHITASLTGYSTLVTIIPSGSLTPTYSSQKIFAQTSSFVTLTIKPQGANSLLLEAVNTSGAAISNMKVYTKGGYKRYTDTTNTAYYFDNVTPSDVRPTTDASGLASIQNLVPGPYYFCGDSGATSCTVGATTHYLIAAIPYSGNTAYLPVPVPTYLASSPPSPLYNFSGNDYYQKARLIFSTSSSFPRISSLSTYEVTLASSPLASYAFSITGTNLPCNSVAASCTTTVTIRQGATNYPASCTGNTGNVNNLMNCTVNLTGISAGTTQLILANSGGTYTSPADLTLGSFNVIP